MELSGKTAIVTGANKGIGLALTKQLLHKGCRVFGVCRNSMQLNHPGFSCILADVGSFENVTAKLDEILVKNPVDILINNAGTGYFGFCHELDPAQWQEMFGTNVNGMFFCCRMVIPGMKDRGFGHIVNIASTAGLEGYAQTSGYCATKFAVRGFSDALYKELREFGIKVTCIYPGSTATDFFRNHKSIRAHENMLQADDLAAQIVYALESPANYHPVNLEIRPLKPRG